MRWISRIYPCTLALALAACGDDNNTSDGETTGPGATSTETTGAPTTGGTLDTTSDTTVAATGDTTGTAGTTEDTDATTSPVTGTGPEPTTAAETTTGGSTDATTDATTGDPGVGEPTVLIDACAPDDGPALEFRIGVAELACDSDFPEDAPIFRVVLFQGGPLAPGAYTLDGGQGFVAFDDGGGAVVNGSVGTIVVEEETPLGVRGTYDVELDDQTALAGSFDAIACPKQQPCG